MGLRSRMSTTKMMLACMVSMAVAGCWSTCATAGWQSFDTRDGLGSGTVRAVLQDHSGNLWFATPAGVTRYDGLRWRTYTTDDGLGSNFVQALSLDGSGHVWIGTESGGASRFDGERWTTFTSSTTNGGPANNSIRGIASDSAGGVWFGTDAGYASYYNGSTWRSVDLRVTGAFDQIIFSVATDRTGNTWFGTFGGGAKRLPSGGFAPDLTLLFGLQIRAIMQDNSGHLWFATNQNGVFEFDGDGSHQLAQFTHASTSGLLLADQVSSITQDDAGGLWFATTYGVSRFDGTTWRAFGASSGLSNTDVRTAFADDAGGLWFGTIVGVNRYDREFWQSFHSRDGLADEFTRVIFVGTADTLWFGTRQGANRLSPTNDWSTYRGPSALGNDYVRAIAADSSGNLWFGSEGGGASRFDGTSWTTLTTADGLINNRVYAIVTDRARRVWFGTYGGVGRYNGGSFESLSGAPGAPTFAGLQDHSGNLWFGTCDGVSRYDGSTWTTFTQAGGQVLSIIEDGAHRMWFGTNGRGVSRYDPGDGSWTRFTTNDGLADDRVFAILADRVGDLWFGTGNGLSQFNGTTWRSFSTADSLAGSFVWGIAQDLQGRLWIGTDGGVSRFELGAARPKSLITTQPRALSPDRFQTVTWTAGFGQVRGTSFSYTLDGRDTSGWQTGTSWTGGGLSDTTHVFRVWARDQVGNVEATPAIATFQIDATPPTPVLVSPGPSAVIAGAVTIRGSASDRRFRSYRLDVRPSGSANWSPPVAVALVDSSTRQVVADSLGLWDTRNSDDGSYEIRLSVADTLGLVGTALVGVVVDNHGPDASQLSPVRIDPAVGGDVYTLARQIHLFFPPHAFEQTQEVRIDTLTLPASPPTGVTRVLGAFSISWGGGTLQRDKHATLTMTYADSLAASAPELWYSERGDTSWIPVGGTVEPAARPGTHQVSATIMFEGAYALFVGGAVAAGRSGLANISLTPRVLSFARATEGRSMAIGFTLGRAGAATVRVYARSGRLMREVTHDQPLGAGANLVRWDGRDRDGRLVVDGLYIVSVEALGERQLKPLAVVR